MSDHYVPFEELRRGMKYEFDLGDGKKLIATFDEYAPAFGAKSPNPPGGEFARVRDTDGRQHSLPREQIDSIKVV